MSGLLEEVATPCPPKARTSRLDRYSHENSSFQSLWEESIDACDDTRNLDFTTEIKPPVLTGAKPRRKTRAGASSSFAIHDETTTTTTTATEKQTQTTNKRKRENGVSVGSGPSRKSSLLAQPAQRFRPAVSFASPTEPAKPLRESRGLGSGQKSQKLGTSTEKNRELLMQINGNGRKVPSEDALKKDVRRNTLYIPPDDTTVASVFMGIFSPVKSGNLDHQIPEDETQINTLESQIARKRLAKQSSTHRPPLRPSVKVAQESSIHVDNIGKNGGKENIPPGTVLSQGKHKASQPLKPKDPSDENVKISKLAGSQPRQAQVSRSTTAKPLAAKSVNSSLQRAVMETRRNNSKPALVGAEKKNDGALKTKVGSVNKASAVSRSSNLSSSLKQSKSTTSLSKPSGSWAKTSLNDKYPLISENITKSAMYEDDWLSHQEVVITQLVNGLLDGEDGAHRNFEDPAILRHDLLTLYQDPAFTHLYKRVQASVLYGALSIPKDVLARNSRINQDLGMKRKFLDFWTQTYDLRALRAAVETITGRRIPVPKSSQESGLGSNHASYDEKALKRKLEIFLDTFLVQNQDTSQSARESGGRAADGATGKSYRRTVLRSIMIIILLDKGRMRPETPLPHRLFLPSSQFKSSAAVLQGLARFLLPSSGDIIKALGHLDCHLEYEQPPLQEYEFHMDNLAVDLRDGVRLTRIVEMLLYPSAPASCSSDNTETSFCPPAEGERHWPLTQKLKFPCLGRAVKLFNVQIALDALAATRSTRKLVADIRADSIVDGHREKTIALLWGLVSKWGLSRLVDWDDVRNEVDRLTQKAISVFGYEEVENAEWMSPSWLADKDLGSSEDSDGFTFLLIQWAAILAQLQGLRLENVSTSFSDGKVYEAIVQEYEGYILGEPSSKNPPLSSRLRALGCSAQFANLVCPGRSARPHILDNDFTIGALAFLCSRLLSATKRARAATVLQRAWRCVLVRRELQQRSLARDVARQCAAVVQTRDQMLWATDVITTWWRKIQMRRQRRRPIGGGKRVGRKEGPAVRGIRGIRRT